MKVTNTHIYFWGSIYSNFYEAATTLIIGDKAVTFRTSEHAFMALKALEFGDKEAYKDILAATDPSTAKAIGRSVKGYDDAKWNAVRQDRMFEACVAKFTQNPKLMEQLIATGDKVIVEASPYDKIWGVGLSEDNPLILDEKNWNGLNLLGEVLMEIRTIMTRPVETI